MESSVLGIQELDNIPDSIAQEEPDKSEYET
jgi:hypothetical protein